MSGTNDNPLSGRGQKLMPLEDILSMCQNVIKELEAPYGRLTGFELDLSRRSIDNTAMESPSIATPGNVEKKRDKFVPPVDVIDFTSGFGLKVIDLTGEVVKNATPRSLEKKGQKFVPPVNVIDLTGEDSHDSGTVVTLRLDRESPEEAGQEQSVGNKAADVNVEDSEDTSGSSIRPDQEPPEEAGQMLQSPVVVSVAAESQGDSQAAENWPHAITILSNGNGDGKDENKSEWGNSVSDKAADVNAENHEDVSGTSRRQDRGHDEEPPEENEQLFQSPVAKSVATDIPPVSPPSVKLEHPESAAESQGDSQVAENCPQAIIILSDDDEDDKDENRSKSGSSMSDKAANLNLDVSDTSRREDEEPPEEAVQRLQSPVAKSGSTGIPPVSPPSRKCQQRDFIGSQGGFQAAVNRQEGIAFRSDDDDEDNDEKRSELGQSLEVDVLADEWKKLDDEFIRADHPRGFTEEETLCRRGKQRKVNNGGDILNNLISDENLHSSLIPFVEDAILPASVKRRKVNLLHEAGYEQLSIQCQVEHSNEPMQVESPFSEDADRAAGHQGTSFTPVVENAKSPASVKQQNVNHGVDEHPPMEAVQQVNESMQVESDGHKSSQQERKSRKSGKRDRIGKVERDKNGKGKAIAEEELEEDEVDEEEEEECAKAEDPNVTEKLKKITAEKVEYEPYVRERCPAEEDPLDDAFNTLRIRFMIGSSGQSSDTRTTKSSPEGNGACKHTNFDFDEVVGFYCGDCGTVGIEMPTSESDPQNKGCLHKNFEFSDEAGKYCSDCGKVWQDIQNCYKADTQIRKGSRKQAQKVQDEQTHEIPQVVVTLQGCSGNDDLRGADLELHPSFEKTLHLHQKKGFKFLTRNLFGGQQGGYESTGCTLEHAPGTGKTCLVISFIQSFLTRFPEGKPLILAPAIMLQTWKDQFECWMVSEVPIYTLGGSASDQDEEDASVAPHVKTPLKEARALELREWQKGRSILLLSYNLFQGLVSKGLRDNVLPNSLDSQITKALKESANLVILDEGHKVRNEDSLVTQAILALETKRRVLLSGTLFQNNFEELFTLLKICREDFMRSDPEFAKKILEYSSGISSLERKRKELMQIEKKIFMEEIGNRLENWEKSGVTSTDGIESVVKKFQSLTSPFVDRYLGEILKTLPGLIEHSIHLNLTAFQSEEIINDLVKQVKNHLIRHYKITAACIHPSFALVGEEASLPFSERNTSPLQDEARKGVKISFILRLMESSNIAKEKLLIFCSTLRPLNYIEDLFYKIWGWRKGQQILRLDGDMSDGDRQTAIKKFNDMGSQSQVLLASTSACKEGISLVGASRVVILDCCDNPSVIRQAVSRAFRMGQKKKVYVYRLVTTHSYEMQVFGRSVSKEKLSLLLLDPVSTISNFGKFLQEQRASDVEDELLRDLMLDDRVNGSHINSVQRYNAGGQVRRR